MKSYRRMQTSLFFLCLVLSSSIEASEFRLLDTDNLSLEYAQLSKHNRDPYLPQYTGRWKDRASILWDSTLVGKDKYSLYWKHNIHTETIDTGAVKSVGWEWRLGVTLGSKLELLHHHHSRHVMDERVDNPVYQGKGNQFPVEDSFVLRFNFIGGSK